MKVDYYTSHNKIACLKYLRSKITFALISAVFVISLSSHANDNEVTVWKSPTCGCCQGWVDYLMDNGFNVTAHDVPDVSLIKRQLGMTDPTLYSCHTAKIGDYLLEGHVPIKDIEKLLKEKPNALGITAPGMPMLSPGMHSIEPKDYDVLLFDKQQNTQLFSRH